MATAQDVWNEIDRRIKLSLDEALALLGVENIPQGGAGGPGSAGGLPVHGNTHHMPPLALQSDFAAHIVTIASPTDLGHVKIDGGGLLIDGDGLLSVDGGSLSIAFLDLTDAPSSYAGQALRYPRVNAGETALEFHAITASDVGADPAGTAAASMAAHLAALDPHPQYLTEAEADLLYADIIHTHDAGDIVSGTLGTLRGGTGLSGVGAADLMLYSTGVNTYGTTALTAFARTLLDDTDAATARATLGLVAGGAGDIWVKKAGDTMTGDLTISKASAILSVSATSGSAILNVISSAASANFNFVGAAGANSALNLRAGGLDRWQILRNSTAEAGGDAGSNFQLRRFDDGGTALGTAIFIERSTGFIGVNRTAATALYTLDINGTFRVDDSTGGIATLSRSALIVAAADSLGILQWITNDTTVTTSPIVGNIEMIARQAYTTDFAAGVMIFRVTPDSGGTKTPVEIMRLHDDQIGVFGATPASRPAAYTITNAVSDRSYDANATSVAELADVIATLIGDLQAYGWLQ